MKTLKQRYAELEADVLHELMVKVNDEGKESKFTSSKAIQIDYDKYVELGLADYNLTLFDSFGYHYSLHCVSLEDLINIIED